jgi:copper homeostasis protein (lipoprotein)
MRLVRIYVFVGSLIITGMLACKHKADKKETQTPNIFKGLYSFEPGAKTFRPCGSQTEFWVADSCAQLELKYTQLVSFEKTGEQVYIEAEGNKIKSVAGAAFDSTLVVTKLINITKDIPANCK